MQSNKHSNTQFKQLIIHVLKHLIRLKPNTRRSFICFLLIIRCPCLSQHICVFISHDTNMRFYIILPNKNITVSMLSYIKESLELTHFTLILSFIELCNCSNCSLFLTSPPVLSFHPFFCHLGIHCVTQLIRNWESVLICNFEMPSGKNKPMINGTIHARRRRVPYHNLGPL